MPRPSGTMRDAVRRQGTRQVPRQHFAVDENATGLGLGQAEQRAHQRALAGAVVANDAEHLPRPAARCETSSSTGLPP